VIAIGEARPGQVRLTMALTSSQKRRMAAKALSWTASSGTSVMQMVTRSARRDPVGPAG
jgi:hypothetical protein